MCSCGKFGGVCYEHAEEAVRKAKRQSKPSPIRSRAGLEQVIVRALRSRGGEGVVAGVDDEPVASVRIGRDRWLDVYVKESDGY